MIIDSSSTPRFLLLCNDVRAAKDEALRATLQQSMRQVVATPLRSTNEETCLGLDFYDWIAILIEPGQHTSDVVVVVQHSRFSLVA